MTASLTTKGWRTRPPLLVDSGNCSPGSVSNLRLRGHTQAEIVVPPVLATTLNLSGGHRAMDRLPTVAEPLSQELYLNTFTLYVVLRSSIFHFSHSLYNPGEEGKKTA